MPLYRVLFELINYETEPYIDGTIDIPEGRLCGETVEAKTPEEAVEKIRCENDLANECSHLMGCGYEPAPSDIGDILSIFKVGPNWVDTVTPFISLVYKEQELLRDVEG